jgi:hypothetical protein
VDLVNSIADMIDEDWRRDIIAMKFGVVKIDAWKFRNLTTVAMDSSMFINFYVG